MSAHDFNEWDCSPTQTPAQTRSTSPSRGSNIPHSHRQAAEFVSRLTSIAESAEPKNTAYTRELEKTGSEHDVSLSTHHHSTVATIRSEHQPLIIEDRAKPLTAQTTTSSPAQANMVRLAKVNAIDGSSGISITSKVQILLTYFIFNLGLTLYNKAVMIMFPFPFLLTALHAASGIVGTQILLARHMFTLKNLSGRDTAMLSAFSVLYTANIAVSNASLSIVTIPFHQTVRALTPVFTVAIYRIGFAGIYSTATYISLIPIIIGVMLTSYGDLSATTLGFFVTLLGTILAAVKTVATNRLQTAGLHFGALELLHRMSPIACAQSLFVAYVYGEFDRFEPQLLGTKGLVIVFANGIIAFGLNVTSFEANKRSGALTMTIAANVKQVLTVVMAVVLWRIPIAAMNACGIALTLLGVRRLPITTLTPAPSSQSFQINPRAIVSDACASYSTLDSLNAALSRPLKDITQSTDFFAYYRLNLYDQKCPVRAWDDETGTCGNIACKVDTLEDEEDIPVIWRASELSKLEGPKAAHPGKQLQKERGRQRPLQGTLGENVGESCVVEYDDECDERDYCIPEDESATAKGDYVSLVDNPERYTGYAGQPVWDAIYRENCFFKSPPTSSLPASSPFNPINNHIEAANALRNVIQAGSPKSEFVLDDECLEKRVFHRIISGMHASISTHICVDYLNQTTGQWGPNLQCYTDRLATHPERVSNLYFNYALLLRAVTKIRTYLKKYTFCSGDAAQDAATKQKVLRLADSAAQQPRIFDESIMFQDPQDNDLKEDFRNRFRNVSRLMDCVGCDKCRLWGKLQTVGYGTALKVLFEYEETKNGENPPLRRTELVALVNTLDRVARSLSSLKEMREMVERASSLSSPVSGSSERIPSKSSPAEDSRSRSPPSSASSDNSNIDDFDDDFEDHDPEHSILTAFLDEWNLVFRTLLYVLKSWIDLPFKLLQVLVLEVSRAWSFWLGLPVQPREYAWEWGFGEGAPVKGEKGEL
ncbi:MAG: hypothetical protein LQ343_004263 [Gyalolechia ehrenbergii]|nr:MAG: hypothetical protein LQ343_004263 [Gyalolechia ehrenbergii]